MRVLMGKNKVDWGEGTLFPSLARLELEQKANTKQLL